MASLARIGRMSLAAGSFILPAAKVAAGIWFLQSSANLVWKFVKPIRDHIRKRSPRFSSGRVQKFYKFTPPRVKRREERKKKEQDRKTCRKTLFLADIVEEEEEDEIPPSEQEIDMKLLISQSFALCPSQCCSAVAHVEDENKVQGEVADIVNSEKYKVIDIAESKVGTDDKGPTEKGIHKKMVEDIGLKCISGVPDEPHSHASTSPNYESPCMTSTPYPSTMPVMYNKASSLDGDGLHSSGEVTSDMSSDENENVEASLCLLSPIKEKVSHGGLVINDSEAVTENPNDEMVIKDTDHSDEIAVEDLFKPFMNTTEDSLDPSNVCIEDVKTESVDQEGKSVKTEDDQKEGSTESKLYIHLSY